MNELMLLENPDLYDDDEEYGLELAEFAPKRRRRKRKNPEPAIAIATPILLLGLAYAGWVLFNKSKFGTWNWQPWQLAGRTSLQLRRTNPTEEAQRQQARQQAAYDRSVEKMMAPSPSVVESDVWRFRKPTDEETVSFIEP